MNATELFHADGRSASVFYCGQCRIVRRSQDLAEHCCAPVICACGKAAEQYGIVCASCSRAKQDAREAERFAKAEKLTDWDGPVFWEGTGFNEGYFRNLEELEDHLACQDEETQRPDYVWTCTSVPLVCGISDSILERISENSYDDWDADDLSGVEQFTAACSAFEELNKDQVAWEPNYAQAILLARHG